MKYKNIIKLRLPEIQLLAVVPSQLKFSIVRDHDEPIILLFETLFCMWECLNMGRDLPTKVMLGQTLVLMQMTFLNNVRKVGRLVLSRTSCLTLVWNMLLGRSKIMKMIFKRMEHISYWSLLILICLVKTYNITILFHKEEHVLLVLVRKYV
jgi:hypothetical protein